MKKSIFFLFFFIVSLFFSINLFSSQVADNNNGGTLVIYRTCKYPTSIAFNPMLFVDGEDTGVIFKCMQPRKKILFQQSLFPGIHTVKVQVMGGLGAKRQILKGPNGSYEYEVNFNLSEGEEKNFLIRYLEDGVGAGAIFGVIGAAIESSVNEPSHGIYLEEQSAECIRKKGKKCAPFTPNLIETSKSRSQDNLEKNTNAKDSVEIELQKLKDLFDKGLISRKVYEEKQKDLLGL